MRLAKVDYHILAKRISELGYSITGPNLRTYVTQRNLSLRVLIYISKALNVSMDYLIGNESGNTIYLNDSFDVEFREARYSQYPGKYTVYFFPTRTNEPEELIEASLEIKPNSFFSELKIPVPDAQPKVYQGHLVLSKKTDTGFLHMVGTNGELIQFTFNDPHTNQDRFRFCVSALISVSSGDTKRMPTLSRAIISERKVAESGKEFLAANLRLNTKYLHIESTKLKETLALFLNSINAQGTDEICRRIPYAFKEKTFYDIEESYFLNTFRADNGLSNSQVEYLLKELRNASTGNINVKVPKTLDSRLYLFLKSEGMFQEDATTKAN